MIVDAACKIRSNGKSSENLNIRIRTNRLPSSRESDAVSWVLTCLEDSRLDYTMSGIQYAWNVVSNILNELETAIIDEDGFASDPEIVVAIRVGHARSPYMYHTCDEDDLVVLDENPKNTKAVHADLFMLIARDVPPPPFIVAVGISAVSDEFMMELWSEIISKEPNTLDAPGKGYMVHPMWQRYFGPEPFWNTVREQSYRFGWKGYDKLVEG